MLQFFTDMLSEPALLMGLVTAIGLLALKRAWYEVLSGAFGPILGYLMIGAGAAFIVEQLNPLGRLVESGFHITGIVPNNEAITATAQMAFGLETMAILVFGLVINLVIARFTAYKYIFLTGHHSFFMACLLSAVLNGIGLNGILLVGIGGFFLGAWSAISPRIGAKYTEAITGSRDIALGHFGSLGYALAGCIGELWGNKTETTEDLKIPEQFGFLRNTTISTGLIMIIFYVVAVAVAGPEVVERVVGTQNHYVFAVLSGLKFSIGVAIVYNGVRMMLADLLPAFQGIAQKIIPEAIPAVDCAVFFPYAPTAVMIGFALSFVGGLIGMFILGAVGDVLIIPGLVPHFFCGATAAIYGNATGGRRGAVLGSFVNGLLLAFFPAVLLPVLGTLGFANTTFGDVDFAVIGVVLGEIGGLFGTFGVVLLSVALFCVIVYPRFWTKKEHVQNNAGE